MKRLPRMFSEVSAKKAMAALDGDADDVHSLWADVVAKLSLDIGDARENLDEAALGFSRIQLLCASLMLQLIADAFKDASNGVVHPLFAIKARPGRPQLNRPQRTIQHSLALVAGVALREGKRRGHSAQTCYRSAAVALRKHGMIYTWQQLRAIWINRARFGPHTRFVIEHMSRDGEGTMTLEEMAVVAAHYHKSKQPLF